MRSVVAAITLGLTVFRFPFPEIVAARRVTSVLVILAEKPDGRYYEQVVRGAQRAARAVNSSAAFAAVSSGNDPRIQTEQLVEAIRDGVDLIVIQRSYAGDGSPAIQQARRAGITVVAIDADVPGGTDGVVKPDERQGGALAARAIAQELSRRGQVAIANGPSWATPLRLRVEGFLNELKKYPEIQVVANRETGMSREGAVAFMRDALTHHPDLKAVYAVNDPRATYCESAALARGRKDLVIIGMEGSPASVAAMLTAGRLISASPGEDPFAIAQIAVEIGAAIVAGHQPAKTDVLVPFVEVNRSNAKGFTGWNRQ